MKILVTSDIHGDISILEKLRNLESYDLHLDAGDSNLSALDLAKRQIISVKGNTDFFTDLSNIKIIENQLGKFIIVHGHHYFVKSTLTKLFEMGKSQNANYVIYGHTHRQRLDIIDNIYYLNPGSLRYGHQYAIINSTEVILKEID